MGLNAEMVRITADLRSKGQARGDTILEFGAQDLCAAPEVVDHILAEFNYESAANPTKTVRELYSRFGLRKYSSVDATGENDSLVYDLNKDLVSDYGFTQQFDLVTNLGTGEHCFNQFQFFKNLHDACRPGGFMIHAAPCAGNVNHGFYNYHPRFFADLAAANSYELVRMDFTVDYAPTLHNYNPENFKRFDSRDLLLYVVLRRTTEAPFKTPFDGMFASDNALTTYANQDEDPLATIFAPYLKGGSWEGTKGYTELPWWRRGRVAKILRRLGLNGLVKG